MEFLFTEEQKKKGYHEIELEEEQVFLEGEKLEGENGHYILTGVATIDGERYHDFQIEFQTQNLPHSETIEEILDCDWEWYDFVL